uniref:1-aminocyclopropane-1-carboxylate deaminase n=1 Tax=Rhizobium sp. TAL1145 TaxID=147233 RepID=A8VU45_9HYPH|nr:1-aminocyclopropane-1-carboxylate deaminase [Rhizobium sp. TAL1145]
MTDHLDLVPLGFFPTPIDKWDNLGRELSISLSAKRDDLSGLGGGGNKIRKLQYLLAEAKAEKATTLITAGATQSNHVRQTAAVARKHGMRPLALLRGQLPPSPSGNLLLDELLGAQLEFHDRDDFNAMVVDLMLERKAELEASGERAYVIPIGGSSPLGALGYVDCAKEMREQFDARRQRHPDYIVVAMGSGGTYAGLVAGCARYLPNTQVLGIVITTAAFASRDCAASLLNDTARLAGVDRRWDAEDPLLNYDHIGPEYGVPSQEGNAAIRKVAEAEGVFLDPTYTGKVCAGLIAAVGETIPAGSDVIFVHTGGSPALFAAR